MITSFWVLDRHPFAQITAFGVLDGHSPALATVQPQNPRRVAPQYLLLRLLLERQPVNELDVALDVQYSWPVGTEGDLSLDPPLSYSLCQNLFERPLVDLIGAAAEEDEAHQLNVGVGLEVVDGRLQGYGSGFVYRVAVGAGADGGKGN